jgi:hypothetical protein
VIAPICAADVENILAGIYPGTITQQGVAGRSVPVGGITMWSGAIAAIPAGWGLCDGTNGTPDLRDKFIIGAASDALAVAKTNVTGALTQAGGTKDAIVPAHTHTAASTFAGSALAAHGHTMNETPHAHGRGESVGDQIVGAGGLGAKLRLNNQSASPTDAATTGISVNTASAGTPTGTVGTTVNSTGVSATAAHVRLRGRDCRRRAVPGGLVRAGGLHAHGGAHPGHTGGAAANEDRAYAFAFVTAMRRGGGLSPATLHTCSGRCDQLGPVRARGGAAQHRHRSATPRRWPPVWWR